MQDVGEHDAAAAEAARQAEQRIARRRERQARVGLLRNTNHPPPPPMRRPPLIGRNLVLRSSRRPKPAPEPDFDALAQPVGLAADLPLIDTEAGRIARIDIDRLARMAESLASAPNPRPSYAEQILGGAPPRPSPAAASDLRAALLGSDDASPDPAPPTTTDAGWRGRLARWIGRA